MPASLGANPFSFDFANNAIRFILTGTPVSVTGRKAISRYKINTFPRANYYITLSYGKKKFVFHICTAATAESNPAEIYLYATTTQLKAELVKKIAQNYYIEKDYAVTVSDTLELTFTARQNGGENVLLQTNDTSANIQLVSQTTGIEKVEKADYKLFAKLEITRLTAGYPTVQIPEILLHPDNANKAILPLTMLRSCFQGVDTPSMSQKFAAYSLHYAMIKCRLVYSDYFDGTVQVLKYSPEYYLVNGKISEAHRALNLPDWNCPMGEDAKLYNFARPRSYGSPSGLTLRSYPDMPQYAYFMFFNTSVAANTKSLLQFRVEILNENGTKTGSINVGTLSLSNFSIVRVPLSVEALALSNHSTQILSYTVYAFHSDKPGEIWKRTFVMHEKPYHAKEFLLQNKYGVLESFFIENEMFEKTVEGEKVTCENKVEIDVQDVFTTYTARTGNKSIFEMQLLEEALENKFHYKIVNNALIPITLLPDTLTVFDEGEDLQRAEFQYCFKIPDKTRAAQTSNIGVIQDFERVWAEDTYCVWDDELIYQEEVNATLTLD